MALSDKRNKDKAMAAYLKQRGVRRTGQNCPICHRPCSRENFTSHLLTCKGR